MASAGPNDELLIEQLPAADFSRVWPLFQAVIAAGETYSYPPDLELTAAQALWTTPPARTYVATRGAAVVGCYLLKPNQPGLGDHVANAGFMVAAEARGQGIAATLCRHAMDEARRQGFTAMQFNFVVSSNTVAVALWQRLGFRIVGQVPRAFRHATLGPTDIYIMYRDL